MLRTPRNRRPPDRFGSWQSTPRRPTEGQRTQDNAVPPDSPFFNGFINIPELRKRPTTSVVTDDDFTPIPARKVTNHELRHEVRKRGLPTSGNKQVLSERLTQDNNTFPQEHSLLLGGFHFEKADISLLRIPYRARFQIADTFISLLRSVIDKNDVSSWTKLLAFGRVCLCQPLNSKENKKKSLSSLVKSQCLLFRAGELHPRRNLSGAQKKMSFPKRVHRKMEANDTRGAV